MPVAFEDCIEVGVSKPKREKGKHMLKARLLFLFAECDLKGTNDKLSLKAILYLGEVKSL